MRLMPICISAAFALFSLPAFAQGTEGDAHEETSAPERHVTVFVGGDFAMGNIHEVNVMRSYGTIGVSLDYFDPLRVFVLFRGGHTRFSFNGRLIDGLDTDLELRSVFDGAIGGGLAYRLLDRPLVSFDARFTAEGVPWGVSMQVERLRATTGQGEFGIRGYAEDHANFTLSWFRLMFETTLALHFDWFHPELTLGIQRYEASIAADLDDEAMSLFNTLGYDSQLIGGQYRVDILSPVFAPGLGFTFAERFGLTARATFIPTGGGVVYGADLALTGSF